MKLVKSTLRYSEVLKKHEIEHEGKTYFAYHARKVDEELGDYDTELEVTDANGVPVTGEIVDAIEEFIDEEL